MDAANFYWEIFAAVVSAGGLITVFIRDRIASSTSDIWAFLWPTIVEQKDGEGYTKEKLRLPFYRWILIHEDNIYGASRREFWKRNRKTIEAKRANPFIW